MWNIFSNPLYAELVYVYFYFFLFPDEPLLTGETHWDTGLAILEGAVRIGCYMGSPSFGVEAQYIAICSTGPGLGTDSVPMLYYFPLKFGISSHCSTWYNCLSCLMVLWTCRIYGTGKRWITQRTIHLGHSGGMGSGAEPATSKVDVSCILQLTFCCNN